MFKAKKAKTLASFLFEGKETENEQPPSKAASRQIQNASLDRIVDSYFIQYEKQAMPNPASKGLYEMIFEAPGDPPTPDAGAEAMPADAPADLSGGLGADLGGGGAGDAGGASPKSVIPSPQLNVGLFAAMVARLVNNFDNLVNPKVIAMNRAFAYLMKNYSEEVAKEFLVELENTHDLSPKGIQASEADMPPTPLGYGSGPSEGGGGGAV